MSCFQIDPDLEEKLNDIDEFIKSELGFEPIAGGSLKPTDAVVGCSCFLKTLDLPDGSTDNLENVDANLKTCHESNEIEVEVQIIGLKDIYNKKTRKTLKGSENRLEDSEVTVVVQATEDITCVRAYIQRCPEAAIKTHDTIGPVEQVVNRVENEDRRWGFTVDLGSVHKTKDGNPVYWLEKADVMQRNKWELIIAMEFSSGLTGEVTSKPFRVTTKAGYKMRRSGEFSSSSCEVQRLCCKITSSPNILTDHFDGKTRTRPLLKNGIKKEFQDDACDLSKGFTDFTLNMKDETTSQELSSCDLSSRSVSSAEEKIVFQQHTVLDRHTVTTYYGGEQRIHRVLEQPEVPGLLKLVGKHSKLTNSRRKANGHKSAEEDLWWACGRCFFERRKKSTIKAHVIQRVCQKSIENKKSRGKVVKRQMQRHYSCDFDKEKPEKYSWKNSLSV